MNRLSTDINPEVLQLVQNYFPQFAETELQHEIATHGKIINVKSGETMMDYGDFIETVPLVARGVLKISREDENGNEIFLYFIRAGESCTMSFSCCIRKKRSEIRAVVEEDALFIAIPVRLVDGWLSQYQSWKSFIMGSYDARMNELIYAIDAIAFSKMDERLLKYLEDKSFVLNTKTMSTTHQDIAQDLNASREAISRLLKKMEKDGVVKLGRNKIQLLS